MKTTFPQLLLQHATQRPQSPARCAKRIWHLANPHLAQTWPSWWKKVAARLHQAGLQRHEHMVVIGANRPACTPPCWQPSRWARFRCRCTQDAVAAECIFPLNNAEVRFCLVEDQEQVDKLLETASSARRSHASSTTTPVACATTTKKAWTRWTR